MAARAGLTSVPAPPPDDRPDREPDPSDIARRIVLQRLAARSRTRKELEDILRRQGCQTRVAEGVLDRLSEVGLVDDAEYARDYVHTRGPARGLSRTALTRDLLAKGVAADVVAQAVAEVSQPQEADRARTLIQRRLRQLHGLPREVQLRRLVGLLARRGYPADISYRVVVEELDGSQEHQRD